MAITNYLELRLELAERINRSDVAGRAASAVELATKRLSRELRLPEMEKLATTTVIADWTELPDDFQEIRSINAGDDALEYRTPWQLQSMAQRTYRPHVPVYTIADMSFRIYPTQTDLDVRVLYYASIPALVNDTDTNWLLEKYPDVYVECGMADLNRWVKDYAAAREHEAYVQKFIEDSKARSRRIAYGAAPIAVRVA
jgi:hypothetical protein